MHEVIGTCAVPGAGCTGARSDRVPVTPAQIAAACIEAARAGAAIAHVHVRAPASGQGCRAGGLHAGVGRDAEGGARGREAGSEGILNLSTGMGGDYVPDERDPARAAAGTDLV